MNSRRVWGRKSWFGLVMLALGMAGFGLAGGSCGGSDATPGTGGSAGTGGTSVADASNDRRDASGGSAGSPVEAGPVDAPRDTSTEADIAACVSAVDASQPCLVDCFCNLCPRESLSCLGNVGCRAIVECGLEKQCDPNNIVACADSELCGPVFTQYADQLFAARAFATSSCTSTCVARCFPAADASLDAPRADGAPDSPSIDAAATDAPAIDAPAIDASAIDAPVAVDVLTVDAPDAPLVDVAVDAVDSAATDALSEGD